MEKFLETQDVVNLIVDNLATEDLQGNVGSFYINKVKFKKIDLLPDGDVLFTIEIDYRLIQKNSDKINKIIVSRTVIYPDTPEFIRYLIREFKVSFEDSYDTSEYSTAQEVINKIGKSKIISCLNLMSNIYEETKCNNTDIKLNNHLTYIEGDYLIKESLTKLNVVIQRGTLTREEITLGYKKMDRKLNEYIQFYQDKGFDFEIAITKAMAFLSKMMLMRIGDNFGNSRLILTTKQPADINKENKEITKIDLLIFTNYYIKYKNKEIQTKKEMEDIIYTTNKT